MKWITIFTLVFTITLSGWTEEIQQPYRKAIEQDFKFRTADPTGERNFFEVSFEVPPQIIAPGTYYDYMLGSYNGQALKMQPETSAPYGYPAGGYYHAFMYQETANSQRRIYYTYIDPNWDISAPSAISSTAIREGFSTVTIDPVTANPFVTYHSDLDQVDPEWECNISYDLFNVIGGYGLWSQPFSFFFAPTPGFEQYNVFWWPVVHTGPSPLEDHRRIHVYGNYVPDSGLAMYNSLYAYVDVQYNENAFNYDFTEWTYQTFPKFDYWQDDQIKRAIKDMAVSDDGQVAFIGHANDSLFIYHSTDYGENFELYMQEAHWDVFNPQNLDESYVFENSNGSPADVFIEPNGDGGHYNVLFTNNNTRLVFMTAFGINTVETESNQQYYPAHFHPKIVYYDINEGMFDFVDLQFTGVDAYDDQPMISYDLDENGEVDSWDENGLVEFANIWPSFWVSDYQDGAFHYSNFKCSQNEEYGIMVAIFQDGRKAWEAYLETPGYEDWNETSEIAICVSTDHGTTWSDPVYLNANPEDENYYEELDGMIPCYIYPCDKLEHLEDFSFRLPIAFFDDNSYGAFNPNGHGQSNGGVQMFAVLKIDISTPSAEPNEIIPLLKLEQNIPNPFNPITEISYQLLEPGKVELAVYNIRGQLIKTLINEIKPAGKFFVTWNGRANDGHQVESGIYFYRLKTETDSRIRKMVLIR